MGTHKELSEEYKKLILKFVMDIMDDEDIRPAKQDLDSFVISLISKAAE